MKPADKDAEMKRFSDGKTNIMATTVIEVGVNVPNASVMIESAERFGLSQLHQLRVAWVVVLIRVIVS
jgi:ATP-dependent DNA helicase RecG